MGELPVKNLSFLLLALFLSCEGDNETPVEDVLPSDEVAWLAVNISRVTWTVLGTDDSLRYTWLMPIYGDECDETTVAYSLQGDSLIFRPDTENEGWQPFALLDSGHVLRQYYEYEQSRGYWDSILDVPTDCAAYAALEGINGEYSGSLLVKRGATLPDTMDLQVWAMSGFLWLKARGPGPSYQFQLGVRAQPGPGTLPLRAMAAAHSLNEDIYQLDNGQLVLESFSAQEVIGVITGDYYDRDKNSDGAFSEDISLQMTFEATASTLEDAPRQELSPWEDAWLQAP